METFSPFELTNENLYVPLRGSTRRRTHQNRTVSRVLISVPLVHSVSHWCTRLQLHASAYALAGLWLGVGKAAGPGREFGVFQSYKDSKVRGNVGRVPRHVRGFGGKGSGITCAPNARPLTGVLVCASFQAGLKMKKSRASRWGPVHPLHITTEHVRDSFRADTVTDLAGVAAIPTYYSEAARILIRSALHAL